jgi:peptidoglycan LD-endopeptidase CwlK
MPKFSNTSRTRLDTCHPDLIRLFNEVIKHYDCTILEGHRGEEAQNEAYRTGKSQLKFPMGKHNSYPSKAVDVVPYFAQAPHIRWNSTKDFYYFAGIVLGVASQLGIKIRWGGDWDGDHDLTNQTFFDLPHFELL